MGRHRRQNSNGDNHILLVDWANDGDRLDLVVSREKPSDQPLSEIIDLFGQDFLENNLLTASNGPMDVASWK